MYLVEVVDLHLMNQVACRVFDFDVTVVAVVMDHHVETPSFVDAYLEEDLHQLVMAYEVKGVEIGIATVMMAVNCCYYFDYLVLE